MKKLSAIAAVLILAGVAAGAPRPIPPLPPPFSHVTLQSQVSGVGVNVSGAITNGHCASFLNATTIQDAGAACGGSVGGGLIGQTYTATGASTAAFSSPALPWGNGDAEVTTTPYNVPCDSGTSALAGDRGKTTPFGSGASVINLPDPTAAGCTGNFAVSLYDDNAGSLTVNRGGTSTINIDDGSTSTDGATSFTLATGNFVLCNANAAGTIWLCGKKVGGGIVNQVAQAGINGTATPSSTNFLLFSSVGGSTLVATEGNMQSPAPRALTVSNLRVRLSAAEGAAATLAITLRDGAVSEAVTCTVGNSATTCTDLTHTFTAAAGDLLDWQIVQTGTGTSQVISLSFLIQ